MIEQPIGSINNRVLLIDGSGAVVSNKYVGAVMLATMVGVVLAAMSFFFISGKSALPAAPAGQKWHEVYNDNFSGSALDSSKWVTCYDWYSKQYNGCSNTGNNELEWYMPGQVSVHNGYAQLTATPDPVMGLFGSYPHTYPYRSGMISTGRSDFNGAVKSSYTYGYFEARLKATPGQGLWPAFWLVPADHSWPPEIDIMEIVGSQPGDVLMTYHWGQASAPQKDYSTYSGLADPTGWHTYAVNWQPGHIDWYIDGVLRKSVSSQNVPNKPMEIIANLAVGGKLPGNPDASTRFPATLDVDYIRVYQAAKL